MSTVGALEAGKHGPRSGTTLSGAVGPTTRASHLVGELIATEGADAVDRAEGLVCGPGAVGSVPAAVGLALSGRRATNLLGSWRTADATYQDPGEAPAVVHRVLDGRAGPDLGAFELLASSAQEAVDHCLVAHLLAERVGAPGVCAMDAATAESLEVVRLPGRVVVHDLLGDPHGIPTGPTNGRSGPLVDDSVLEAAHGSFDAVAVRTGRPVGPLFLREMDDAQVVIVSSGAAFGRACEIAEELRSSAISCGVVNVALLRPFPTTALADLLKGKRAVVAMREQPPMPARCALLAGARASAEAPVAGKLALLDAADPDVGKHVRELMSLPKGTGEKRRVSGPTAVLAAEPAGPFAEHLLLGSAALLGRLDAIRLARVGARGCALALGRGRLEESTDAADVLFLAHPSLLDLAGSRQPLKKGGTLVVVARASSPEAFASSLPAAQRRLITEGDISLVWVDESALLGSDGREPDLACRGALLAAAGEVLTRVLGREGRLVEAIVEAGGVEGDGELSALGRGASAVRPVTKLSSAGSDGAGAVSSLRMPAGAAAEGSGWTRELRQFHLTGVGAHDPADSVGAMPLRPAALEPFLTAERLWRDYPLYLSPSGECRALGIVLTRGIEEMSEAGEANDLILKSGPRLVRAIARSVQGTSTPVAFRPALEQAASALLGEFELSEAAGDQAKRQIEGLAARLPRDGSLLSLGPHTAATLAVTLLARARQGCVEAFDREVTKLAGKLADLLRADAHHGPEARGQQSLAKALGTAGGALVDPEALAGTLPKHRGGVIMAAERRSRIEGTLRVLRRHMERDKPPSAVVVHSGQLPADIELAGARVVMHADSVHTAVGLFDGHADQLGEVLRAVRVARLEVEGVYDPQRHDRLVAQLNWRSFDDAELGIAPRVLVLADARDLRGSHLGALSDLLFSGRPIAVLVAEDLFADAPGSEGIGGYHPGLGYLALAHREAMVLASSLGLPEHLTSGLERLSACQRPAVAIVAAPRWGGPVGPAVQLAGAHEGRAAPVFLYDVERGATWAERLDVSGNPQPERVWPRQTVSCLGEDGAEQVLDVELTFADVAALDPSLRQHLRVIPPAAWSDEQVTVGEYIASLGDDGAPKIPFIWVVQDDGTLARAVITQHLVFASADRARQWRIIQELGGMENEHVRRAIEAARAQAAEALTKALEELEAKHATVLEEVRSVAAGDAMQRLVDVLLDIDSVPVRGPARPSSQPEAAPAAASPSAAAALQPAAEPEEDAVSFDDPYIDSALCTTCNECTNINPLLFKYNGDKQAYIADANAGTFKDLVVSAEKCPARCIHPGKPRSGDASATPDFIARAQPFN